MDRLSRGESITKSTTEPYWMIPRVDDSDEGNWVSSIIQLLVRLWRAKRDAVTYTDNSRRSIILLEAR